jgi:hypothetical protein
MANPIHIGNIGGGNIVVDNKKPLFSFSAISDIHLHDTNDDNGYDDLVNLFRVLGNRMHDKELNLKYIFAAGDIGLKGHSASDGETHEI